MPTRRIPPKLFDRAVTFYTSTRDATHRIVARIFGVAEATTSRALRRYRETGLLDMPVYAPRNKIDLDWPRARAMTHTDALLREHAAAFIEERCIAASLSRLANQIGTRVSSCSR